MADALPALDPITHEILSFGYENQINSTALFKSRPLTANRLMHIVTLCQGSSESMLLLPLIMSRQFFGGH